MGHSEMGDRLVRQVLAEDAVIDAVICNGDIVAHGVLAGLKHLGRRIPADKQWSHLNYLTELIAGEAAARDDRRVQRCIALARFPVLKTLDQFDWNRPTKINRSKDQIDI